MKPTDLIQRRDVVKAAYFEGFERSDVLGVAPGHGYRDARHAWMSNPMAAIPAAFEQRRRDAFIEAFDTWERVKWSIGAPAYVAVDWYWQRSLARAALADLNFSVLPGTRYRATDRDAALDSLAIGRRAHSIMKEVDAS
jgi:hypothetical protein